MKNIRVKSKEETVGNAAVKNALEEVEALIGNNGRVLLRQSGTEPLIRIMVECERYELCEKYAEIIERKDAIAG